MITAIIMNIYIYTYTYIYIYIYIYIYKTLVEIPKNISGNIPGGSFPYTDENICEEFLSVYALTWIFIRKIFVLQTHSLRVYSPTNNNFFLCVERNISSSFSSTDCSCKCP